MIKRAYRKDVFMNNQWLSAHNFERAHEVIAAINKVSIHEKLLAAGRQYERGVDEVRDARRLLANFLERLDRLVAEAQQSGEGVLVGIDPRLGLLAQRYALERR